MPLTPALPCCCCFTQVHLQCLPDSDLPAVPRHHHMAGPMDMGTVEARDGVPGESPGSSGSNPEGFASSSLSKRCIA